MTSCCSTANTSGEKSSLAISWARSLLSNMIVGLFLFHYCCCCFVESCDCESFSRCGAISLAHSYQFCHLSYHYLIEDGFMQLPVMIHVTFMSTTKFSKTIACMPSVGMSLKKHRFCLREREHCQQRIRQKYYIPPSIAGGRGSPTFNSSLVLVARYVQ